jgi:prophage maintenance system killer protein
VRFISYVPPIPNEKRETKKFSEIVSAKMSSTQKALDMFCNISRKQLFWDGNKRCSLMIANKLLINNGAGIMLVKEKYVNEFNRQLSKFYETGEKREFQQFLYDKCIFGTE